MNLRLGEKVKNCLHQHLIGELHIQRKTIVTLTALVATSLVLTAYTASAHYVALHVYEGNGTLYWTTPGYTFLPWPTTPSGAVIQVLVLMNQADQLYYQYIIKSGALIALTIILWAVTVFATWKMGRAPSNTADTSPRGTCEFLLKLS